MKRIILVSAFMLSAAVLSGCGGDSKDVNLGGNNAGDGGGGNNVINLQTFVLNNCNDIASGMPTAINGSSFPDDPVTDPTQSVYTKGCLNN